MRVHPKSEQITLEQFLLSFQDSMDTEDDSSKILPILQKHTSALAEQKARKDSEKAEEEAEVVVTAEDGNEDKDS
jgi:hypothetical protein